MCPLLGWGAPLFTSRGGGGVDLLGQDTKERGVGMGETGMNAWVASTPTRRPHECSAKASPIHRIPSATAQPLEVPARNTLDQAPCSRFLGAGTYADLQLHHPYWRGAKSWQSHGPRGSGMLVCRYLTKQLLIPNGGENKHQGMLFS
jgi:hypothetical protein